MIERLAILATVLTLAWLAVWFWERRRHRRADLPPGITVVTGPHCRLCDPVVAALRSADPDTEFRIVTAADLADPSIQSLPTVLVADDQGREIMRRSGRSALTDAAVLAQTARVRGSPPRASNTA